MGPEGDGSTTATGTETETTTTETTDTKPTETVEFWRSKSREQEKRAKDNAAAAKELAEIKEARKTESEKTAERLASAAAEVEAIPAKVASALREHLVEMHQIDKDDAELFLTATTPELMLKQVARLVGQSGQQAQRKNNYVSREGSHSKPPVDDAREAVRGLFGGE